MRQVNTVNEQIKNFMMKHFPLARHRNVNDDDLLLENGILDSLGVLELVTYLEQEFKIRVSDEDLVPENFQTIARLTTFVQERSRGSQGELSQEEDNFHDSEDTSG